MLVTEHFFYCPYCNENISMLIEADLSSQKYIEDCEVCCRPIEIYFTFNNNQLIEFYPKRLNE